ncbi:MAG: photosystem reaction center subunit [Glaciihabitans sp.]|nr:photosystem reaction center subunit [Glaciihabitans sp.]
MIDTNNISSLIGADVLDPDGDKVGTVGQVYVDDASGQPSWITVRTGLFGSSESFVPLDDVTQNGDDVRIQYDKGFVKDAPRIDNDGALTPEEEDTLYEYYGHGGSGRTTTTADGTSDINTVGVDGVGSRNDYETVPATNDDALTPGFVATGTTVDDDSTVGRDTVGHDTSGPTTDRAMTRSEEQLHVGTEKVESGRARLRKYVVTENQTVTVPVSHEEVTLEREPITDANIGDATAGPDISEEEHEVVLTEERVVVDKETVPVERVRVGTNTVVEDQEVTESVRKEKIDLDGDGQGDNTVSADRDTDRGIDRDSDRI